MKKADRGFIHATCFRGLVQEFLKHKVRSEMFGIAIDTELARNVQATKKAARVTLTEHYLYQGLKLSETNKSDAKDQINGQIKAWPMLGITFQDVHPRLWELCQDVCAGKKWSELT